MKLSILALALASVLASGSVVDLSGQPECVPKCWESSKYISTCNKDNTCLCEDAEFQSAVLQCLYSQCQTTRFGSALHFALSACPSTMDDTTWSLPPILGHQGLRKRDNGLKIHSASGSATRSLARRSASGLPFGSPRPTRSVGNTPAKTQLAVVTLPPTLITSYTSDTPNHTKEA